MRFGDVYFMPRLRSEKGGHYAVVIFADKAKNKIYLQTLNSGLFKIFPNFGILNDNGCARCPTHDKAKAFREYILNKARYLDVDDVVFLNFNKYPFLKKETFICWERAIKRNYFDFEQNVKSGTFKYQGCLSDINKKQSLIAFQYSSHISPYEKNEVVSYINDLKKAKRASINA